MAAWALLALLSGAAASFAESQNGTIACASQATERRHCPADTSSGVALVRSTGAAPCLLGKTWGYDDKGIWVSDGCSGEFTAGQVAQAPTEQTEKPTGQCIQIARRHSGLNFSRQQIESLPSHAGDSSESVPISQ